MGSKTRTPVWMQSTLSSNNFCLTIWSFGPLKSKNTAAIKKISNSWVKGNWKAFFDTLCFGFERFPFFLSLLLDVLILFSVWYFRNFLCCSQVWLTSRVFFCLKSQGKKQGASVSMMSRPLKNPLSPLKISRSPFVLVVYTVEERKGRKRKKELKQLKKKKEKQPKTGNFQTFYHSRSTWIW